MDGDGSPIALAFSTTPPPLLSTSSSSSSEVVHGSSTRLCERPKSRDDPPLPAPAAATGPRRGPVDRGVGRVSWVVVVVDEVGVLFPMVDDVLLGAHPVPPPPGDAEEPTAAAAVVVVVVVLASRTPLSPPPLVRLVPPPRLPLLVVEVLWSFPEDTAELEAARPVSGRRRSTTVAGTPALEGVGVVVMVIVDLADPILPELVTVLTNNIDDDDDDDEDGGGTCKANKLPPSTADDEKVVVVVVGGGGGETKEAGAGETVPVLHRAEDPGRGVAYGLPGNPRGPAKGPAVRAVRDTPPPTRAESRNDADVEGDVDIGIEREGINVVVAAVMVLLLVVRFPEEKDSAGTIRRRWR